MKMKMKNRSYLGLLLIGVLISTSVNAADYLGGKRKCINLFYKTNDNVKIYDVVRKSVFSVGKFRIYYRDIDKKYENHTYSIEKCSVDYINGYISLHGKLNNNW